MKIETMFNSLYEYFMNTNHGDMELTQRMSCIKGEDRGEIDKSLGVYSREIMI